MIEFGNTKVFAETFEQEAYDQVRAFSEYYPESTIRIMPDAHAGTGCTIGTTMTILQRITPGAVGVDISCGVLVVNLSEVYNVDFKKLDEVVHWVPSGFDIHDGSVCFARDLDKLKSKVDLSKANQSLGTLGGGNHFIELDYSPKSGYSLVIHSGSRNLGFQVCKYYQKLAVERLSDTSMERNELIARLKAEGREKDIHHEIKKLPIPVVNKELAHLEGKDFDDYINDMRILQVYARDNRATIAKIIMDGMGWKENYRFETLHNYIDTDMMILRKGAVRALSGELLIIPMNMRDGSLICMGKGNPDWNYSAPHGAGRLMSRAKARESLSLDDFKDTMKDIYSSSVCESTIDEAPMAYKNAEEIMRLIEPTVDIVDVIKPVYNFKAN